MTVVTDDPYIWLEEVESEESLQFARDANDACLKALGDPTKSGTGTYDKVLSVLESSDRIPYVAKYGKDDDGNDILMNFWKDSSNPKGLWRKTTMTSYRTNDPQWEIVLDVDDLAKKDEISWVWKVRFTNSSYSSFPRSCRIGLLFVVLGILSADIIFFSLYLFLSPGSKNVAPRS
jgi:prolyl oligopeptidase